MTRPEIDYGERLRIGMIVPSGNVIAEPQVRAMMPKGVGVYVTRLPLTGTAPRVLEGMVDNLDGAAQLLADARVNVIAFNCTAVSTYSLELEAKIHSRIESITGISAALTSRALVSALKTLSARCVVLLTPYRKDVNEREVAFLQSHGIEVVAEAGLGLDHPGDMAKVGANEWLDFARRHRHPDADACFISCTAIRTAEIIETLERELNQPVITSNQAAAWQCLRMGGITDTVAGFGSLLSTKSELVPHRIPHQPEVIKPC